MKTKKQALDWLNAKKGTKAIEYGGAAGTQCPELSAAYADYLVSDGARKIIPSTCGDGKYSAGNLVAKFPNQFMAVSGNDIQAGDILSEWSTSAIQEGVNKYGHTSIVIERTGGTYKVLEQWVGSGTIRCNSRNLVVGGKKNHAILAAARPIFSDETAVSKPPIPAKKSNDEIANEVIRGDWGTGNTRKIALEMAGYDYAAVQAVVNAKMTPPTSKFKVKITADALNIRKTPEIVSGNISGVIYHNSTHTIVEEKGGWGKLEDGRGWISLTYTVKI